MAESSPSPSVRRLQVTAGVTAVLALIQLVLGLLIATGIAGQLRAVHGGIGYLTTLSAVVAAVFAWQVAKLTGAKGVFFHALSLPVLMIVQIGLAEVHLEIVHIILGVLIVAGVVGLVPMAAKQAATVQAHA